MLLIFELVLRDVFDGRRDVDLSDLRSHGQGDLRNQVVLTGAQGERGRLRGETFRYDTQLKCSGRHETKGKLTVLIGLHFLNDGWRIAHKFYVGPSDAVADLIDNRAADSTVPLLGLRGG